MDLKLNDKVAIITGGARGMGKAYCSGFAREGATVVIVDLDEREAKNVASQLRSDGSTVVALGVDVSKYDDVEKAVSQVLHEFGKIDILVNNAGIRLLALLEETTEEIWNSQMDINLKGPLNCCKAVIPQMKERRYGKIINVSSLAGKRGHALRGSAYAASKGGLLALTKSIAREVAPFNINVNAIAPSVIRTGFLDDFSDEDMERLKKLIPLGRVGEVEDVVGLALLLASDVSSFIHGQTINVDGGQRMD
jgi:3-oxoacyl-[acyl-carrier protein] reductase